MRLYIIRHADPDYANKTITAAGHLEAQALAERMKAEGINRIYTSPLGRARHTMEYTATAMGLPFEVEEWTQEIPNMEVEDVSLGKVAAWNVDGAVIRSQSPMPTQDSWSSQAPFEAPKFNTIFEDLKRHSDEFLARHGYRRKEGEYRIESANRDRLAVFCHGGFGLTWIAHLLEIPVPLVWAGFLLAPSSVTTILFDERGPTTAVPRCLGLSDTSHLYKAGLPIQPAGIVANFD